MSLAGIPLKGYFAWSFVDESEWTCGYSKRFGQVYIDFENQQRIPKDSAYWYRNVIDSGVVVDRRKKRGCQAIRE